MVSFLSIAGHQDAMDLKKLDEALAKKDRPVFVLVYMEGCGPCNMTRPEWAKLKNVLKGSPLNVVVADINKDEIDKLKHFHHQLAGFPTMLLFEPGKQDSSAYEDAESIGEKNRTVDSFVKWIKSSSGKQQGGRRKRRRCTKKRCRRIKSKKITRNRRRDTRKFR